MNITIVEGGHADLAGPLRDGQIDLMVGALRMPLAGTDLVQQALFEDRPIILGRAGHPLHVKGAPLDARALSTFPWIVAAEGTPLRAQWQAMFRTMDTAPPRVPISCGSVMMAREILRNSDFLTLLASDQVAVELEAGWLVNLGAAPGNVTRTIGVTHRADWRPTALQSRFLAIMEEQATLIREGYNTM